MPEVLSRYELDKYIQIFEKDIEFQNVVVQDEGINLPESKLRRLVELLLQNEDTLTSNTIEELNEMSPPFLRNNLADLLDVDFLSSRAYKQILYTFKYSSIKTFFRDNWKKFVPEFDVMNMEDSEQITIFTEAFMREFDRFSDIIDEIYNIPDIDRIPDQYLNYLAQAIGYEREDEDFLFDASFRELVKNIIEIYRIKGTNFSFELFFNFLGFEATVREFWFDKRFFDPNISSNEFTNASNRNDFMFYLTTRRPTEYIPQGMRNPRRVSDDEIMPTMDGNEFNVLTQQEGYTPGQLLGLEPGYDGEKYTFFKTNVMEFELDRISGDATDDTTDIVDSDEGDEGDEGGGGLSAEELETIRRYANFLTPLFVSRNIVVAARPFQDDASILILTDANRRDPRATNPTIGNESMFHNYVGYQPSRYYWEDGIRLYDDPIPPVSGRRWPDVHSIEPGGNFINGFFKDTFDIIFDKNNPDSVFSKIQNDNPEYSYKQTIKHLRDLIDNKSLFDEYEIPERDLMTPLLDIDVIYPILTRLMETFFGTGTRKKFSSRSRPKTYRQNYAKMSYHQDPEWIPSLYNRAKIKEIVAENEEGYAEVVLHDQKRRFQNFDDLKLTEFEDRLFGDFKQGSRWIENIEYNREVAPEWTPKEYEEGDFVRDVGTDNVLRCIESHDASGDGSLGAQREKWITVVGIDILRVGKKIKTPYSLFEFEIVDVDRDTKSAMLSAKSPITENEVKFKYFKNYLNFIQLKHTINNKNDGIYTIKDWEAFEEGPLKFTRIILQNKLNEDQENEGGFLSMYRPKKRMKDVRYPFLYNELDIDKEQIGTSMTSHFDELEFEYMDNPLERDYTKNVLASLTDRTLFGPMPYFDSISGWEELVPTMIEEYELELKEAFSKLIERQPFEDEYLIGKQTFYEKSFQGFKKFGNYVLNEEDNEYRINLNKFNEKYYIDFYLDYIDISYIIYE